MSLNLGTLTGFLDLDTSAFDGAIDGASSKIEGFGGKGAALAAGAGLAVGAALAAGVVGAMNVEAANDKLAAQLGLTSSESERIGKVAGGLYANAYGESLTDVNGAVAAVMTSIEGMSTASSADLEAVTKNALDFATAMDVDVAGAARTAGILVKTGLAENATEAFDLLTVAAQEAGPAMVEPIMEAANEYGVNFAAMGISGSGAMAILVEASKGGEIALDKAGDAIKEFGIRATDLGDTGAQEALEGIGLSGTEMANALLAGGETASDAFSQIVEGLMGIDDPAEQAAASVALFGTPLEDIGKDQIPVFLEAMSQAGMGMDDVAGAADAMGATLNDNASTNLEAFKRQIMTTFVDFVGGQALPAVNSLAAALATGLGPATSAVTSVVTSFGAAIPTPLVQAGTVAIAAIVAVLALQKAAAIASSAATAAYTAVKGIFITVTNAETGAVTLSTAARVRATAATVLATAATVATTAATSAYTAVQWLLNAALSANPLGIVIIALAAIAAGLVIAWKNSESFRDVVVRAFQVAVSAVSLFLNVIEGMLRALGRIPGFGWADAAADKIAGARASVDSFNRSLDKIPPSKLVTVTTRYIVTGNPDASIRGGQTERAGGGPVSPYSSYLVGEHGPELLTLGSVGGKITPSGATADLMAQSAKSPTVDLSELVGEMRAMREDFRRQADRTIDRSRTNPVRVPA